MLLLLFCANTDAPVFTHAHTHTQSDSKIQVIFKETSDYQYIFQIRNTSLHVGVLLNVLSPCEPAHTRVLEDSSSLVLEL